MQRQTQTAIDAYRLAEEALHLTERADLMVIGVTREPKRSQFFQCSIAIRNFGRTRASEIKWRAVLHIGETTSRMENQHSVIVAGGDSEIGFSCPMNPEISRAIGTGQPLIRIELELDYQDVFEKKHSIAWHGGYRHSGYFEQEHA